MFRKSNSFGQDKPQLVVIRQLSKKIFPKYAQKNVFEKIFFQKPINREKMSFSGI